MAVAKLSNVSFPEGLPVSSLPTEKRHNVRLEDRAPGIIALFPDQTFFCAKKLRIEAHRAT
jgi:hypothetical protein